MKRSEIIFFIIWLVWWSVLVSLIIPISWHTCTQSEETTQIMESIEADSENRFIVNNMTQLNIEAIKDRLDSIDIKLDWVWMECADLWMILQQ